MSTQKAERIRVLSLRQPWADEIIFGRKWCENRTWDTKYRGELWIHASSQWDTGIARTSAGNGDRSAIIGRVRLVDVIDCDTDDADDRLLATIRAHRLSKSRNALQHVGGPFCFILARPEALAVPIPCRGKLNFWFADIAASELALQQGKPTPREASLRSHPPALRPRKPSGLVFAVGRRCSVGRRNYWILEIDDDLAGLSERKNGAVTRWETRDLLSPPVVQVDGH